MRVYSVFFVIEWAKLVLQITQAWMGTFAHDKVRDKHDKVGILRDEVGPFGKKKSHFIRALIQNKRLFDMFATPHRLYALSKHTNSHTHNHTHTQSHTQALRYVSYPT